jgi:AMMECR1 domain-containing protein
LGSSLKRGLLLPQVAVEHHLTAEQFLAETCRKAGLPPEAWRQSDSSPDDASRVQLFAFTCQVFSEP